MRGRKKVRLRKERNVREERERETMREREIERGSEKERERKGVLTGLCGKIINLALHKKVTDKDDLVYHHVKVND